MATRTEVKALLARSQVAINDALHNVDQMTPAELQDVTKIAPVAFFDKNGSCGATSVADLRAVFDKNGSCGAVDVSLETALQNVLSKPAR
ncbi:hypothetical protein [Paraherbaspirillum soli]|uniref:Uncharacterized protein n=1 Tax=Paraherbaspirillum soli TaxID=631222 RepID=A0ABW0MCD8_9BURK